LINIYCHHGKDAMEMIVQMIYPPGEWLMQTEDKEGMHEYIQNDENLKKKINRYIKYHGIPKTGRDCLGKFTQNDWKTVYDTINEDT
jgi:hypothetical protein